MIHVGIRTKLETAWDAAQEAQAHPSCALDKSFAEYPLVERDVQFSDVAVPAGRWFVDWGLPRRRYGGFELVESTKYTHICRSKLASALCPECRSPIFTVLLPTSNGNGKRRTQQLCLSCGHRELLSLPR